ncbi:tetratricopeptide repeat protein [Acidobacteriota bacterium]
MKEKEGLVRLGVMAVLVVCFIMTACGTQEVAKEVQPVLQDKIPITTASDEALQLYLKGRDLNEKLRATDARQFFKQAVEKDPGFALAHLALATTAPTNADFFDSLGKAVGTAELVSEAERHWILGFDAAVRSEPETQRKHYTSLIEAYPNDERAHILMAGFHFGRQEYTLAVEHYEKVRAINPEFSQPYNQLGYAYRFLEQYDKAEKVFRKYTELIPDEPNPYDSYAELLMKVGKFDDSIEIYRKALALNPEFMASHIGIGSNQTFMGEYEKASDTFKIMYDLARNKGEKRQALFWSAVSLVHEGRHDDAVEKIQAMVDIAKDGDDFATMAGDLVTIGDILLDKGTPVKALDMYVESLALAEKADTPEEVKETARRNHLYNEARAALAGKDLKKARDKTAAYGEAVNAFKIPFELRRYHELSGRIALLGKDYDQAIADLGQAGQQDPVVLFLKAQAHQGKGEKDQARELFEKAANFNGLNINYAYVRKEAGKLLEKI